MTNTPKIRFKGFVDDWEQRKFGDMFERRMERNGGQFDNTHWISVAKMYFQEPDKVTSNNIDTRTYVMRTGDIAFEGHSNSEYKYGRFVENDIGDGVISELFPIYKHIDDYDLNYWKYAIQLESVMQEHLVRCIEISYTSSNKLDEKSFLKESVLVPSVKEQQRIGAYFAMIDNLITLHQRKCDETKELKKYMLQKMFPKNGMTKPEIRFKGFTDDWEQRKLGEISDKVTKKNQDVAVEEVFTNSAEFGIISQRDFFDKDIANAENIGGYYVVEPDDFVYNPRISTTAPFGPIKRNKLERTGAMSPLYYVFRPHDIDLSYLEWFFQTTCWHAFMRFNGNSGARSDRFAITDKIFNEMPISMPQDIEEQKKIGVFLTELESLITLHQRKCDELKEAKKYMLQNMFPKKG